MNALEEIQMAIIVRLKTQRDDLREEVERLRERLAAAEAVCGAHGSVADSFGDTGPCPCGACRNWRKESGR